MRLMMAALTNAPTVMQNAETRPYEEGETTVLVFILEAIFDPVHKHRLNEAETTEQLESEYETRCKK